MLFLLLLLYMGPQVVKSYREGWRKVMRKCSQVKILKNKMMSNAGY